MKVVKIGLLSIMLVFFMALVGCSDDSTPAPKHGGIKIADDSTDTSSSDVASSTNAGWSEYGQTMAPLFTNFSEDMGNFSDYMGQVGNDPTLLEDNTWKHGVAGTLVNLQRDIDQIKSVPAPDGLQDINDEIRASMDQYQYVVDNFPQAVDTIDIDLIKSCANHLSKGSDLMDKANVDLQAKTGQ